MLTVYKPRSLPVRVLSSWTQPSFFARDVSRSHKHQPNDKLKTLTDHMISQMIPIKGRNVTSKELAFVNPSLVIKIAG